LREKKGGRGQKMGKLTSAEKRGPGKGFAGGGARKKRRELSNLTNFLGKRNKLGWEKANHERPRKQVRGGEEVSLEELTATVKGGQPT